MTYSRVSYPCEYQIYLINICIYCINSFAGPIGREVEGVDLAPLAY